MARRAAWTAALLALALTGAGSAAEPASATGACSTCCEELTPRGCAPGIFNCADCCACCDDLRVYRSEILGRLWVRGEYLAWAMKGQEFPPLVAVNAASIAPDVPLGRLRTFTLVGDEELLGGMNSGGRLTGGFWWTPEQFGGIEGSFFEVDAESHQRVVNQDPLVIGRPYHDVTTGQDRLLTVASPGVLRGSVEVGAETQCTGGEALLRQNFRYGPTYRVDFVGGYRHAHLGDQLLIRESLAPLVGYPANTYIDRFDLFRTENDFHGLQLGTIACLRRNNVSLQLTGKVGIGQSITDVDIDGGTAVTQYTGTRANQLSGSPGGLLALPSNMGHYHDAGFGTFEELGLNLQLQLTCLSRVFLGYNFMYWSRVARVADQLDLGVNPTQMNSGQLVGPARPAFNLDTTDFWAQGLNVGFEYQF
jgi:hypothetical protein